MDWLQAAGGYFHSLAIKSDGTLWSWGGNNNGELGQASNVSSFAGSVDRMDKVDVMLGFKYEVQRGDLCVVFGRVRLVFGIRVFFLVGYLVPPQYGLSSAEKGFESWFLLASSV